MFEVCTGVFLLIWWKFFMNTTLHDPSMELVQIVDEENNPVCCVTRGEMRRRGLIHRAAYILVFNGRGELFVQKRTMTKDIYPGYYDIAAGGVVLAEEAWDDAARRELAEETGISGAPLARHFPFYYSDKGNRVWGMLYSCKWDGEMRLQPEEVESGEFMSIDNVFKMMKKENFTPDGVMILKKYLDETAQNRD